MIRERKKKGLNPTALNLPRLDLDFGLQYIISGHQYSNFSKFSCHLDLEAKKRWKCVYLNNVPGLWAMTHQRADCQEAIHAYITISGTPPSVPQTCYSLNQSICLKQSSQAKFLDCILAFWVLTWQHLATMRGRGPYRILLEPSSGRSHESSSAPGLSILERSAFVSLSSGSCKAQQLILMRALFLVMSSSYGPGTERTHTLSCIFL